MISIIICSVNELELAGAMESIEGTIGVEHELIVVNNLGQTKGIGEVYNLAVKRAKYDTVCFMHEDIVMIAPNWGFKVLEIFDNNPRLGLLGIAGGGYKSLSPSSWYNYHLQQNGGFYCSLAQGFKHSGKPDTLDYRNPRNEPLSKVACIDGCWFCTKKSVLSRYSFDDKLLNGFHGYDLDFSIAVGQEYDVAVTFEILLKHLSEGNFNQKWLTEILKMHKKWASVLPVNVDQLPETQLKSLERHGFEVFLDNSLSKKSFSKIQLAKLIWSARKSRVTTFSFIYKLFLRIIFY